MLELVDVRVAYGATVAVDGVSVTVGDHETVALLGPSGSGKSTLLRAICGLEPLSGGKVLLDGRDLLGTPVHERNFGLMFQDYVLFPQRDVRGNVAFGLEMRGAARTTIDERVDEVLALVGLSGFASRPITELSGGEQQRVAMARALAPTPRLLMLDEPLGALDRALRERLLDDLAALFAELKLPTVYVTHDQQEAFEVADRVAIMRDARLVAIDSPAALWSNPPDAWTATFLGFHNVGEVEIQAGIARTPWGTLRLADQPDGPISVVLRPEALRLDSNGAIHGLVAERRFQGDHTRVIVMTDAGAPLELEVRDGSMPEVGERVSVGVDARRVNVLRQVD